MEESAGGEESEVGVPKSGAAPESFPVDPVAPVGLPPEESVVVVEPSLEESVVVEESEVDVLLEESVEESGGEEESDVNVLLEESVEESGGESMTGCPEPVRQLYWYCHQRQYSAKWYLSWLVQYRPSPKIL